MMPATSVAALAVCVAAVQLSITTGRSAVALSAGVAALASLVHARRARIGSAGTRADSAGTRVGSAGTRVGSAGTRVGSAGEVLAAIVLGGAGTVLHALAPEQNGIASAPLRSATFVFAFTGLAMAALRLNLARPEGGLPGTLAAAALAFLACGTVRTGIWLPRLFAAYLALAFVAIALDAWERGRAPAPWRMRGRHAAVVLLLVAVVPGVMWTWGRAGPKLVRSTTSAVLDLFGPLHRAGFHDGPISLHALDGLSDSDEVVMRIDGDLGGHLRGNVYLVYEKGRWVPVEPPDPGEIDPVLLASEPADGSPVARIAYVSEATDHYFLPLGARPFEVEPEAAIVDPWQLVRADEGKPASAAISWPGRAPFEPAPPGAPFEPAPPGALDLQVPERLRTHLDAWRDARLGELPADPVARARRLESVLASDFTYSTSFREAWVAARRARPKADPVVLFLEDLREGHCEYFASALALLLRSDGIPARLVSGYRVAERNPLGGWAVVREKHAHAWVEAYLPGVGWTTLDGTPLAATTAAEGLAETPRLAAVYDWLARQAHVHGRSVLLVMLVVGLALAQIVRLVRGGVAGGRSAGGDARRMSKALQALLSRLADAGFERAPSESLEALARRLRTPEADVVADGRRWREPASPEPDSPDPCSPDPALPEPVFLEAAELLDRYAALRYGDVGHRPSVESALARWPEPVGD